MIRSARPSGARAQSSAAGIASDTAMICARTISSSEAGTRWAMASQTRSPVRQDCPQSPVTMPETQSR